MPRNDNNSAGIVQQGKMHRTEQGELLYTIGVVAERTGVTVGVIRQGIRQGLFDAPGVRVEGRQGYLFTPGEADEIARRYRLLGGRTHAYLWVLKYGMHLGRPKDGAQLLYMINGTAPDSHSPSMRTKNVKRLAAYYGVSLPNGWREVPCTTPTPYRRPDGTWVCYRSSFLLYAVR